MFEETNYSPDPSRLKSSSPPDRHSENDQLEGRDFTSQFVNIPGEDGRVLIECPGATLYAPGTDNILAGVRFLDPHDPSKGFEIVDHPVFGPQHVRYRWVKSEDRHLIRRCQSCQDHTVRMRRKEGPDLYIPSRKRPASSRAGRKNHNANTHISNPFSDSVNPL